MVYPLQTSYTSQQSFLSSVYFRSRQMFSPPLLIAKLTLKLSKLYLPLTPLYMVSARILYIWISTPAELSNLPPVLGNCFTATFWPVSRSTQSQTMAMPPLPRRLSFLKPEGHLFPNYCFSWSDKITTFFGPSYLALSTAECVLYFCDGLISGTFELTEVYAFRFLLVTMLSLKLFLVF